MTDPIADMLTRIRNAQAIKHNEVLIPHSKVKFELGKILKAEGFIDNVKLVEKSPQNLIKIFLKYNDGIPAIKMLKRISKPGRKVYKKKDKLPRVLQEMGVAIISTSKGLMTDREARRSGLGGEILCEIW